MQQPAPNNQFTPAILEYLRNLTPQILFFAFGGITWMQLDWNKPDISLQGLKNVLPPLMFLGLFLLASILNILQLIEKTSSGSEEVNKKINEELRSNRSFMRKVNRSIGIILKDDPMFVLKIIFITLIEICTKAFIFYAAIFQAASMLR